MRVEHDNPSFNKMARNVFSCLNGIKIRSVCLLEGDEILGGCAFTPVRDGSTFCYLIGIDERWATKEGYAAIQGFPFLVLGAEKVLARVAPNSRAEAIALSNGGAYRGDIIEFTKEKTMEVMQNPHVIDEYAP